MRLDDVPNGLQRDNLHAVRIPPFQKPERNVSIRGYLCHLPYSLKASTAYSEHVGMKRHDFGSKGEIVD